MSRWWIDMELGEAERKHIVISPYKWNRIKGKIYALDALIANTEEHVFALILQAYIDAKHNDNDFVKCGLEQKSKL